MGVVPGAGYLAGFATYVLAGELVLGEVLVGVLPKPVFSDALRWAAPQRWRWEAGFALDHAEVHATRDQARLAERGEWALNEKAIVARAGLEAAEAALIEGVGDLEALVVDLRDRLASA